MIRTIQKTAIAALMLGAVSAPQSSAAQGIDIPSLMGQWGCQHSMQPFNGVTMDTHYWEYALLIAQNGQYQMQGYYYNQIVGQVPVNGQGGWTTANGPNGPALSFEGQLLRQDSGWMPFTFMATPTSDRNMYLQFRGNTHMLNIVCQR